MLQGRAKLPTIGKEVEEAMDAIEKDNPSRGVLPKVFAQEKLDKQSIGGLIDLVGSVVKLLVEMLEPYEGCVFDPCCGSGGMFVQSEKFIEAHQDHYKNNNGKKLRNIKI